MNNEKYIDSKHKLYEICNKKVPQDPRFLKRLKEEFIEIDNQNFHDYFIDLYDKKLKYRNANNLLVPYLLGITDEFNIDIESEYTYGDFPDIDLDFLPSVRTYLKNEWAPKKFGQNCVVNICSYNIYGIKKSITDAARVHDKDVHEIQSITTKMGLKDEDNDDLTWESALEMYPEFKSYCEKNSEVAEVAQKLLGRRCNIGKHAGGLIISNVNVSDIVPLVKDKDGNPTSSWVEGLHSQDLGPVGFIKYDLLVITNLMQIAIACKLIKERYKLSSINALPGDKDWSDISYLNDKKALKLANEGKLRCIFQFDSDGIRNMIKKGGVDRFEDLAAYNSLYRPGPMSCGMHERYIARKKGKEKYETNEILDSVFGDTYYVMVYQEQVMKMLNVIGLIPLKDCETVRKAISKKKIEYFEKYKKMFVENGQCVLNKTKEELEDLWKQIEAFAGYGFNKSHAFAYTYISSRLLWLKAHYPLEFFTSILQCEDEEEKIQEYIIEARKFNVKTMPLHINKSKENFTISKDNKIYIGFSNIKGIGEKVAEKIVENQPYKNFNELLNKAGTDAKFIKPILGLNLFGQDPKELYKYYVYFKDIKTKRQNRNNNFQFVSKKKQIEKMKQLIPQEFLSNDDIDFNDDFIKQLEDKNVENINKIKTIYKKYQTMILNHEKKIENDIPIIQQFEQDTVNPNLIVEKDMNLLSDKEACEMQFYGFLWIHPLEKCSDYTGHTFEKFTEDGVKVGYIEVKILKIERKISKKNTYYYLLSVEDANCEKKKIQIWMDDWEIFEEKIRIPDVLLRVQVIAPTPPWDRYTLYSPPKYLRYKLPKKDYDLRVVVLTP